MKKYTILLSIATAVIVSLTLLALNLESPLQREYQRCLKQLMTQNNLSSESAVCSKFKDMAVAKSKIAKADTIYRKMNQMMEGPAPNPDRAAIAQYKKEFSQLQSDSRAILAEVRQNINRQP